MCLATSSERYWLWASRTWRQRFDPIPPNPFRVQRPSSPYLYNPGCTILRDFSTIDGSIEGIKEGIGCASFHAGSRETKICMLFRRCWRPQSSSAPEVEYCFRGRTCSSRSVSWIVSTPEVHRCRLEVLVFVCPAAGIRWRRLLCKRECLGSGWCLKGAGGPPLEVAKMLTRSARVRLGCSDRKWAGRARTSTHTGDRRTALPFASTGCEIGRRSGAQWSRHPCRHEEHHSGRRSNELRSRCVTPSWDRERLCGRCAGCRSQYGVVRAVCTVPTMVRGNVVDRGWAKKQMLCCQDGGEAGPGPSSSGGVEVQVGGGEVHWDRLSRRVQSTVYTVISSRGRGPRRAGVRSSTQAPCHFCCRVVRCAAHTYFCSLGISSHDCRA